MQFVTWDNAAIALAVIAVLFRLADRPRTATVLSTLSVLASAVAGWLAHRARVIEGPPVAPLPSSATRPGD